MGRTVLTDDQLAVLFLAPAELEDELLARALGVTVSAVHSARWRLKTHGWSCRVSYGICTVCGESFTRQGHRSGRKRYHEHCRTVARKQINVGLDWKRWQAMDAESKRDVLERGHAHSAEGQRMSEEKAINHGQRWSEDEDLIIMDPAAAPDHELAQSLGRTLYAVRDRRQQLVAWARRRRQSET